MSQGFWTQISHHWFTTLFSMVAAWAALCQCRETAAVAMAAADCGGSRRSGGDGDSHARSARDAGCCHRLRRSCRQRTKLIVYVLGSALIPICLLAYVIGQGALAAAFDDVIVFTAKRYASIQSVPFGYFANDQNRPLKYLFPIVALLTLIICARDWRACLSRPLVSIMRRLWPRGIHRMFSASGYRSHRLCDAFGLPLADILHEPNRRIVASEVPLCACRACNRSWYSSRLLHFPLLPIPRCVENSSQHREGV